MLYGSEEFNANLINLIKKAHKEEGRHSCYSQCVEHAEEMSWHLYGTTPTELLERARPREDPEIKDYRIQNYEPTTKSAADKAINVVSKIFNPNLYSIRWKEETTSGRDLKKYTLEDYPVNNSIVNYMKDVVLRKMLADPNAVAAVKPMEMPQTDADQLKPVMVIFGSANVWNFDIDHYLIFIRSEDNGNGVKWYYFQYYDKVQYILFRAYLSPTEQLYHEELEVYVWNLDQTPVWHLQGIVESQDNGDILYKSFFASAAPFWNLAIVHESDVLGAYINHMHPLRWEISEECDFRKEWEGLMSTCRGGILTWGRPGESAHIETCEKCNGTGTKSFGPYGVMKIPKSKLDPDLGISTPVDYVNVPTEATKMLEERAARMEQKGLWAINMDVEDEVGEVQSGVAKAIDRSAQYDTLYNIATVVFDVHLQNFYYFANALMNGVKDSSTNKDSEKNLPEINKPTQFDIAGTPELINNLKAAKESGLDASVLNIKEQEILTRDFTTNPDLKTFAQKMLDLDPLPGMTPDDISLGVMKGFVSQVDSIIHFNKKRFIERAISENKDFLNLPKQDQIEVLEKYGLEFMKKNKPKLDTSMLDATNQKSLQTEAAQA
jgi:hypothetical protein